MVFSRIQLSLGLLSCLAFYSQTALACDLCAVYNTIEAKAMSEGKVALGVYNQFTSMESSYRPEAEPDAPKQYLDSNVAQVYLNYAYTDRIGLQVNIPYIERSYRRLIEEGVDKGNESGLGDISVLGRYTILRQHKERYSIVSEIFGGVKLPSGDSDRLREGQQSSEPDDHHGSKHGSVENNTLVSGHDLALGTGAVGGIIGSGITMQYKRAHISANLQYQIRQEGTADFRYGNDLQWELAPGAFLVLNDNQTFILRARLSGDHKDSDENDGRSIGSSAQTTIFLGPEALITSGDELSLRLGLDAPIKTDSNQDGVEPTMRVSAGVSWRF